MNWENIGPDFEEEEEQELDQTRKQQEDNQIEFLLQKFRDPDSDSKRQEYIRLVKTFNDLLAGGLTEQVASTLINEDTELFIFSTVKGLPVEYSAGPKGVIELYTSRKIRERDVKSIYVDQEKHTAIQISRCKIQYEDDDNDKTLSDEFSIELFTIKDEKISKYRASFASLAPAHNGEDPFILTRKDKMLAKVKRINYALAGQPDFDKVASLLHETTEYTILSWETDILHTFNKDNFALEFRKLEAKFSIKCIVPYELYTETQEMQNMQTQIVIGTYAYHLEERTTEKLYVWLSSCAYAFDENINITKVSQQGELYAKDEVEIPFESFSQEKVQEQIQNLFHNLKPNLDIFYNDIVQYNTKVCRFGPHDIPVTRNFHGIDEMKVLLESLGPPESNMDWIKPIDVFVDLYDPSYEVVIGVVGAQGVMLFEDYKYKGQQQNFLNIVKIGFENGKVIKFVQFFSEVPYPIPSPFDNKNFFGMNFKQKIQ